MDCWTTIPRRGYVTGPTPLEEARRFSKELGMRLRIKRDDLLPLGGNKIRKLDYIMADAVSSGADTVITASTNQCCHNSMAALLANREGMQCKLIMESWGDPGYQYETASNHRMLALCGVAEVAVVPQPPTGPVDRMPRAVQMAEETRKAGGRPYLIPRGGAGPLGAMGYVRCAAEILEQCGGDLPAAVVCPCGIGGTQAGLTVGFHLLGRPIPVIGIGVTGKDADTMERSVMAQCGEITDFLKAEPVPEKTVRCLAEYAGKGYGRAGWEQVRVMELLARSEGILTDPVYSGKTLYGAAELAKGWKDQPDGGLLFIHTGGLQLFYDYSAFSEMEEA